VVVPAIQIIADLIANVLVPAISSVIDSVQAVVDFFQIAWQTASDAVNTAVTNIGGFIDGMLQWFRDLPGNITAAIGDLGNLLLESGRNLIDGFLRGLKDTWNTVVRWVQDSMAWLRGFWPFSPAKRGAFSGSGYVTHSGKAMMKDFAASIRKNSSGLYSAADGVMSGVRSRFEEPLDVKLNSDFERGLKSLPSSMSADVRTMVGADDFGKQSIDDMAEAMGRAIDGRKLTVDGNGVATLVNKENTRRARRGR
jgi:phage-related protein